jgi:TolB-like protein
MSVKYTMKTCYMRYLHAFFSLLILLIIFSCSSKRSRIVVDSFPVQKDLFSQTTIIPVELMFAFKIIVTDEHLIVFDNQKIGLLKVFKLPSIKYLSSWGHIGKGPDGVKAFEIGSLKANDDSFAFLDFLKYKTASVVNDSIRIVKSKWIRTNPEPLNGLVCINDSIFVFNSSRRAEFEQTIFNTKNKKQVINFGSFRNNSIWKKRKVSKQFRHRKIVSKPDGTRIAVFYSFLNMFKIYNTNGNLLKEIIIKNRIGSSQELDEFSKVTMYISETVGTENYIFVLNPNASIEELSDINYHHNPTISVWDWDGNPIAKYNLDRSICSFDISERNKKIYAVSNLVKNEIYEFDLPILNK